MVPKQEHRSPKSARSGAIEFPLKANAFVNFATKTTVLKSWKNAFPPTKACRADILQEMRPTPFPRGCSEITTPLHGLSGEFHFFSFSSMTARQP
jgi:hypothetical protein